MNGSKVLLVIVLFLAVANPIVWRLLGPLLVLGGGLVLWWLIFRGIKAVLFDSKRRDE